MSRLPVKNDPPIPIIIRRAVLTFPPFHLSYIPSPPPYPRWQYVSSVLNVKPELAQYAEEMTNITALHWAAAEKRLALSH